jgi:hypothetical protein
MPNQEKGKIFDTSLCFAKGYESIFLSRKTTAPVEDFFVGVPWSYCHNPLLIQGLRKIVFCKGEERLEKECIF